MNPGIGTRLPADYLQRSSPIATRAYGPAWAPNATTAVYTYQTAGKRQGCIARVKFVNRDSVTRTIRMAIVPAGGTITDEFYDEINAQQGGSLTAGKTLYYERGPRSSLFLVPGDRIVLLASAASTIATEIWVEDLH
jgi:hypothetical protein